VFKTEPLYPPSQGDEADPGFMQSLIAFFTKLWSPSTTQAEQLGYAYVYDEQGTLIAEVGSGGTNSAGQSQYIYLPTGNGPMPVAAVIDGTTYAVHSDHLNTPRKLTNADGQAVWQWGYSAFGEDKPTLARYRFANTETTPNPGTTSISEVKFNLRYPGQYADEESGLSYNYFRSYDARTGRYSQPDPIGLDGGWNRFGYVDANPIRGTDPFGLANSAAIGWMKPKPSGSPAGTTLQIGLSGNLGAAVIGLAGEVGLATTPQFDDACFYAQFCGVAGPQLVAACGISYSVGDGFPSSGVSTSKGVTWFGGAGLVGAGQVTVNDSTQMQGTRGGTRGQFGGGAGVGYVDCVQKTWCLRR
jgi:RHS repeat-associated protein